MPQERVVPVFSIEVMHCIVTVFPMESMNDNVPAFPTFEAPADFKRTSRRGYDELGGVLWRKQA